MQPVTLTSLTAKDVVTSDRDECFQLVAHFEAELCPQGTLECLFAAEVVRATWSLRSFTEGDDTLRNRIKAGIRRDIAELRRLRTDRSLNAESGLDLPILVSVKDFLRLPKAQKAAPCSPTPQNQQNEANLPSVELAKANLRDVEARLEALIETDEKSQTVEMKKRTQSTPRNAPCPCRSGQKYKRCCGHHAPPVLNKAA